MSMRLVAISILLAFGVTISPFNVHAEVVRFRLQFTDVDETPLDTLEIGQVFLMRSHVEDVRALESFGEFAAYMDIESDGALAESSAPITYGEKHQNGKSGTAIAGLFGDIGSFSSNGGLGIGPIDIGENLVFSAPMQVFSTGTLLFQGKIAGNPPAADVLVYSENRPVSPDDLNFGNANVVVESGQLAIQVVPEPQVNLIVVLGFLMTLHWKRGSFRPPERSGCRLPG